MQLLTPSRRGLLAATVAVVSLSFGCATTARRTEEPPAPPPVVREALTPAEENRALALAHYGTALAISAEQGITEALPEYLKAYELDPQNLSLALWLGQVYRDRHEATYSQAILDKAVKANPKSGEPWVAKGITFQSVDDQPAALSSYQQALKIEPTHYGAIRALVDIYLTQNDTNSVVTQLDYAFHQKSEDPNYWVATGDLFIRILRQNPSWGGRIDRTRSRQSYEKALALAPRNPEILARVGDSFTDAGNYKAAAEAYARLMEVRPNIPQLRERLAELYSRTDQKDRAIPLFKELIKREPLRFEFYNDLGSLYEESGKPEEAISYYQQSIKLNPDQPDTYLSLCELQRTLKHTDDANKTLEAWKKKFPIDWRVPYFRALMETQNKDFAKAVVNYADAETLAHEGPQDIPLRAQFYFGYGAACERAGEILKAAPLFRKAISLDPKFSNAYNYLGYMWADKGTNLTEALELIQKAVSLEPDNSAYLDSLGWVFLKLGRTDEALPALRRSIELLEKDDKRDAEDKLEDAVVYDHLAEVLLKMGKREDAILIWKRATQIDPANKEITEKLQKYNADHSAAPK